MDYVQYNIQCPTEFAEIIIAFLGELPFDTFQENEQGFEAFIPSKFDTTEIESEVKRLQTNFDFKYEKKTIVHQNWNQVWESNFQPVEIEGFCGVRADFHPPFENIKHEIIINPRMAFGTGHHETTFMVMEFMKDINFKGKKVFDYGCGTGILAILAAKMGCTDIDGVDIEEPAYVNSIENAKYNSTANINYFHGTLENVPVRTYDIILANINRNVILESLPSLYERLNPGGVLYTSGFLDQDKDLVMEAHLKNGFLPHDTKQKGKWIAAKAFRRY